jgi:ferredoxin-NADP reductase
MKLTVNKLIFETADCINLYFDKPKDFNYYPAQFIDVILPQLKADNSRIFSLSSSPTEDYLMITFRPGISEYKKILQTLTPGEEVEITHPNGTYTLDESTPAIMLAAGVGIAPHRSMIKYAVDNKLTTPLILVYSNSTKDFPFKKELNNFGKKVDIHYIITESEGRLTKKRLQSILSNYSFKEEPIFYLAGLPSFVYHFNNILQEDSIDSINIRLDSFDGY